MSPSPNQQNSNPQFRLAIVGGGIGGLALALCLSHMDYGALIDVDIYEAATQMTQVGAGISIWPRTWEILAALGLEETLIRYLGSRDTLTSRRVVTFRKSDQKKGFNFTKITSGAFFRHTAGATFHRAELQKALLSRIPPRYRVYLAHRLTSFSEKDNIVELTFSNGTKQVCDFVVGADGVKSAMRKQFLSNTSDSEATSIEPIWTGSNAYRGLISSNEMAKLSPHHSALSEFMLHIVTYPISQGDIINVVAFFSEPEKEGTLVQGPPVTDATVDEVISKYEGWDEDDVSFLRLLKNPTKWAIQKVKPMKLYAAGRVALLGDAVHAMPPHLGSGGGQAIEDAYIFALLLSTALRKNKPLSEVVRIYNAIRVPVANEVMERSMTQGALVEFNVPGVNSHINTDHNEFVTASQLSKTSELINANWDFVWKSAEPYRKKAMEMLMGYDHLQSKL